MAAFAGDSGDHGTEVRPGFHTRRVAMEAAEDGLGILEEAECRAGVFRSRARMAQGAPWCLRLGVVGDSVLEVSSLDGAYRCDCLRSRSERPFEESGGCLRPLDGADAQPARDLIIGKADAGPLPKRLGGKQDWKSGFRDGPESEGVMASDLRVVLRRVARFASAGAGDLSREEWGATESGEPARQHGIS